MGKRDELGDAALLLVEVVAHEHRCLQLRRPSADKTLEQRLAQVVDKPMATLHPTDELDRSAVGLRLQSADAVDVEEERAFLPAKRTHQNTGAVHA